MHRTKLREINQVSDTIADRLSDAGYVHLDDVVHDDSKDFFGVKDFGRNRYRRVCEAYTERLEEHSAEQERLIRENEEMRRVQHQCLNNIKNNHP